VSLTPEGCWVRTYRRVGRSKVRSASLVRVLLTRGSGFRRCLLPWDRDLFRRPRDVLPVATIHTSPHHAGGGRRGPAPAAPARITAIFNHTLLSQAMDASGAEQMEEGGREGFGYSQLHRGCDPQRGMRDVQNCLFQ